MLKKLSIFSIFFIGAAALGFLLAGAQSAPSKPLNVSAAPVSSSQIDLSWSDTSNNETGFLLHQSLSPEFLSDKVIPVGANTTNYSFSKLNSGTKYYFRVDACNAVACAKSDVVSAVTLGAVSTASATPAPQITSIEPISACGVRINFNSTIIGTYEFQASTRSDFKAGADTVSFTAKNDNGTPFAGSGALVTTSTSARISYWNQKFYNPGVGYWFKTKVIPSSGASESDWSAPRDQATLTFQDVGAPQNIRSAWADAGYKINVLWVRGNPTPAKFNAYGGFEIYRASSNDGGNTYSTFSLVERLDNASLSNYEDNARGTGLNLDLSYKYKIYAYQSDFECALGDKYLTENPNQLKLSPSSAEIILPARPSNLTATVTADKKIKLNWQDNSKGIGGESGFEIWRKFDNGSFDKLPVQINQNQTNYIDGDIQPGKTYTYKVRACHSSGSCSAFTPEVSQMVGVTATDFSAKGIVYASEQAKIGDIYFEWPTHADFFYTVERKEKSGGNYQAVCGEGKISSCTDENVPIGESYLYRLKSRNVSDIAYSPESSFNLDIKNVFKGTAWSAYKTATGMPGVGWISLNSDTPLVAGVGVHSSDVKYSIQVDSDGLLSGIGWGHVVNHTQPDERGYGWFSFNKSDLGGCLNGSCEARLDSATGKISGWARFLGPKNNFALNAWDGWVSLRTQTGVTPPDSIPYGLCFGSSLSEKKIVDGKGYVTGQSCNNDGSVKKDVLSGVAWAGPIVGGWFAFGTSTDVTPPPEFIISPPPPHRLAIRESKQFSISETKPPYPSVPAKWYVKSKDAGSSPVWGGSATLGTVLPLSTALNASTTYTASSSEISVILIATSTDTARPGFAATSIDVVPPYDFSCRTQGESSILLLFSKNYNSSGNYPGHRLRLLGGTSSPPTRVLFDRTDEELSRISFTHDNLASSTTYNYIFETTYTTDSFIKVATASCTTSGERAGGFITDAPTKLSSFGQSASKIYVNWKDNTTTTQPYSFQVQRIKVTPATTTDFKAAWVSPIEIKLNWGNITSSTPYFHEFQRSTSTGGLMFRERIDEPEENDPSLFKSQQVGNYNSANPPSGLNTYSHPDSVQEATTYYYRIRACSSIDLTESYGIPQKGDSGKPNPACGKYDNHNVADWTKTVSTTTPPKAPTNFTATADSSSQVTLRWMDNSLKESEFEIKRNGQIFTVPARAQSGWVTYIDSGLNSDTRYDYTIRSFYNIPPINGGGRMYSTSISAGDTTYFVVNAGVSPGDGGVVTDDSGVIHCPPEVVGGRNCTAEFPWGTQVSLIASPNSNFAFNSWTGVSCVGGLSANPCRFTGNANVTANFRVTHWSVSVSISGATGTVTSAPIGINCVYNGVSISGICSSSFSAGSTVTLTATPSALSSFKTWGGSCSGVSLTCSLLINSNKSATAEFIQKSVANITPKYLFARFSDAVSGVWKNIFSSFALSEEDGLKLSGKVENVFGFASNVWSGFRESLAETAWWIESKITEVMEQEPEIAKGAAADIENYYLHAATTTGPVYIDEKVESDTVYLYRVRVRYEDGRTSPFTNWSNLGAVKTMRDVGGGRFSKDKRPICIRNSYCDTSLVLYKSILDANKIPKIEESEQQCYVNADCRDVGRADQSYRER